MSKIALVNDDRNILTSVSMTLEAEGFEVETYNDGQSALDAFNKNMPELAVLDIKMPRMDGMDLLQRLRQKTSMPVIFLTSKDDEIDEVLGLRMGADDYVKKPFSQRLLVERIRALLRRMQSNVLSDAIVVGDLQIDTKAHRVARAGNDIHLGPTEFRLLEHFMRRPGQVFSREQLLDAVWGHDVYVEVRTVDVHIGRLRKALKVGDRKDPIRTVRSAGYALRPEA